MTGRPLAPDERALWRRVTADVRPLHPGTPMAKPEPVRPVAVPASPPARTKLLPRKPEPVRPAVPPTKPAPAPDTLDGSWDRRLRRGTLAPDMVVDLHGHTLASAHATLDAALATAVSNGDRVLLIVAGRERPEGARGAIRRAVGDWLAASSHASRIAAVRAAHPRHGGGGAFYLILRKPAARRG